MSEVHETIKEPQLPKHERGLDVTLRVTRCAGRVSANTRPHQLRWGDSGSVGACMHEVHGEEYSPAFYSLWHSKEMTLTEKLQLTT